MISLEITNNQEMEKQSQSNRCPHFIIIGAAKCGTTSLYNYLTAHPQVLAASQKELKNNF